MIRLLAYLAICLFLTSCTPKSDLDMITEEVLKHKSGIEIDILPKDKPK